MRVRELLERTCAVGGSDLHLHAGLVPRIRVHGELADVAGCPVLSDRELRAGLRELVSSEQWSSFEQRGDLDYAYGMSEERFRANYFEQAQGIAGVMARQRTSPYLPGVRSRLWRIIETRARRRGKSGAADDTLPVVGPASGPVIALISRLPLLDEEE